jgi:hypothetical protein
MSTSGQVTLKRSGRNRARELEVSAVKVGEARGVSWTMDIVERVVIASAGLVVVAEGRGDSDAESDDVASALNHAHPLLWWTVVVTVTGSGESIGHTGTWPSSAEESRDTVEFRRTRYAELRMRIAQETRIKISCPALVEGTKAKRRKEAWFKRMSREI